MIASSEDSLKTTRILLNDIEVIKGQCVSVTLKNGQPKNLLKDLKLSFSGEEIDNPLMKSEFFEFLAW